MSRVNMLFIMGLLNRNNSGRTYDGKESDRGGAFDRIKWEMQEGELVFKFPYDNITTKAPLVVGRSQKAFFSKDGVLYDSFTEGTYDLTTGNIPFLSKLLNLPTGGNTPFVAEVWFVNVDLVNRNMPWGSKANDLRIMDPYFQIPIKMGARGHYGIKISDPEVFLKKMVGTLHSVTTDKVYEQFRVDVIEGLKVHLHTFMKQNGLSINDIGGETRKVSDFVKKGLDNTFSEYGIELLNFNIEGIVIDENDPGYIKVMEYIAKGVGQRHELNSLGDNYAQVRQLNILEQAAQNEGMAGGAMGAGLGAGMGFGMGNMMGNMMGANQPQANPQPSGPPPAAGSAPPPSVAEIYLTRDGQNYGPYNVTQIKEFVQQNIVTKESLVWKSGMADWVPAETLQELKSIFQSPTVPPPPPPPPPAV